jgi:hypothetical protein
VIRPLLWAGTVLIVAGVLVIALTRAASDAMLEGREPSPMVDDGLGAPSRVWSVVGGVTIALGAACIGIGMNRWGHQDDALR